MTSNDKLNRGQLAILDVLTKVEEASGAKISMILFDKGKWILSFSGNLYPNLYRLENRGLITSRWEDPSAPARRLYKISDDGRRHAPATQPQKTAKRRFGIFAPQPS